MASEGEQALGAAAFESALDVLAQLIGHGQGIISDGSGAAEADESVIAEWQSRVERWVRVRRDLEPGDAEGIRTVLEIDAPFLRRVRDAIDE